MDERPQAQGPRVPEGDRNRKGYTGSSSVMIAAMAIFGALLVGALVFIIWYLVGVMEQPPLREPIQTAAASQTASQRVDPASSGGPGGTPPDAMIFPQPS